MGTLKEKAELILQEKEEKIIPDNYSQNLNIFGVYGNIREMVYGESANVKNIFYHTDLQALEVNLAPSMER